MSREMLKELSQRDLAAVLGLTTQQIRNLEDRGLPHRAEGRLKFYPVPLAVRWYVNFKVEDALPDDVPYTEARSRREQARARLAELEVAKEEGKLIPRELVEEIYGEKLLDVLRRGILNMPGRWASQVVGLEEPREGEAALKRIGLDLLESFSGPVADDFEADGSARIPEDCPGLAQMVAAGIETISDLLGVDELQDVPGIGPVTEQKIREWLRGRAA